MTRVALGAVIAYRCSCMNSPLTRPVCNASDENASNALSCEMLRPSRKHRWRSANSYKDPRETVPSLSNGYLADGTVAASRTSEHVHARPKTGNRKARPPRRAFAASPHRSIAVLERAHVVQELLVVACLAELVGEKLHGFNRRERVEDLAQNPGALQVVFRDEELFFAGARALDVDGREDALVDELAVEDDFHVAGALELFEDDLVHARAGVDERRRDNC